MRKALLSSTGRAVVMGTIAVLVLTLTEPPTAAASAAGAVSKGISATTASGDATDFSARRRYYRHYRGNNAAGLAIMGMMIGTIGSVIAAERQRDYYDHYYGGPGYYGYGPPVYYGYGPYYGPRYYRYYPY